MELIKVQVKKKDILALQKGKNSVIDIETSEPDDIESVKTDTSSDDSNFVLDGV